MIFPIDRDAPRQRRLPLIAPLVVGLLWAGVSPAAPPQVVSVNVPVGGSRVVRFRANIVKVDAANPKIAFARQLDVRKLNIVGSRLGETTILVWDSAGTTTRLVVSVSAATEGLNARLKTIFPNENITTHSLGQTVVLTGTASDPVVSERANQLASAYVNQGREGGIRVLNFINIRGRQQVQLRAKVAEVSRKALRQMGAEFWARTDQGDAAGLLSPGGGPIRISQDSNFERFQASNESPSTADGTSTSGSTTLGGPLIGGPFSGAFGLHFATGASRGLPLGVALKLMAQRGLAKTLSEPTLVAYSGQKADFLSGGEFPIPVPQGLGQTGVEYKRFGVQLSFTPTVLGKRTIHLKVAVTVSSRGQSVGLGGVNVPSLDTRFGETTVRLRNGQSFAIAGLLQDIVTSSKTKVPLLGDIPIIGALFSEKEFTREERELVILVTANLVRPLKPGEVPALPGEDEIADPGALAFFLLGSVDPELKGKRRSGPAGPVGYSQ